MSKRDTFDFDFWLRLARENPAEFETMRKHALQEVIDRTPAPGHQRMQGLQWQVDRLRERADNPMASCVQISKMMWNAVLGERGLLDALENPGKWAGDKTSEAKVVPLHK